MKNRLITGLSILVILAGCNNIKNSAKKAESPKAKIKALAPDANASKTEIFNHEQEKLSAKYNVDMSLPYWEESAEELKINGEKALKDAKLKLDTLAATDKKSVSFENTILELENIYYDIGLVGNRISVISETSTDKKMRDIAKELEVTFSKFYVDAESRRDIYDIVQAYADTSPSLQGEDKKLLKETLRDFKRVGFHLPQKTQDELKKIKKELSQLSTDVSNNIGLAGKEKITFTKEELDGLKESDLSQLTKNSDGTYSAALAVTYQVVAILKNAKRSDTRKKASKARSSRAKKTNKPITTKMIKLRSRQAKLLGYKSWADYKTEVKMAKTGKTALDFVNKLTKGLDKKFKNEIEELRKLKVKETGNTKAQIEAWDISYYTQILEKTKYDLDLSGLKKYFSYRSTLNGMFNVFSKIFKLKIEMIEAPYKWDEKVELVKISDSRDGKPLGFLYLDMFPRPEEEKYGHFAQFGIRSGKMINGKYNRPVAALICNFPKATGGKPSLLEFRQVETLFHEFGHALHTILTETKYASFAGTRVARDFVEAPSQMLENWVNDKGVLDMFAVNYEDANDKFPADMLKKIKAANLATVGTFYRRQLSFGKMDLLLHHTVDENDDFDIIKYTNKVLADVYIKPIEGTSFITAFGHLFGGYDAGYYGYAWADNLAADMASKFEDSSDGFLDEKIGMKLREEIYQVGSSREITDSIEKFLGRKSNNKAFLKKLGL